jgi:hypothetical protein
MTDGEAAPARRSVLAAGGLLVVAACTGSVTDSPPVLTADQRLAARVAAEIGGLSRRYAATIAAHPRTRGRLAPLAAEHEAHVAALVALQPRATTSPTSPSTPSTSPNTPSGSAAPAVADSPAAARRELAAAENAAAARRDKQAGRAGSELARLLASIAACETVHAALVTQ